MLEEKRNSTVLRQFQFIEYKVCVVPLGRRFHYIFLEVIA